MGYEVELRRTRPKFAAPLRASPGHRIEINETLSDDTCTETEVEVINVQSSDSEPSTQL